MGSLIGVIGIVGACSSPQRTSDRHTLGEQRRIAEACLSMLHSSLTNETDIQPNDPRVPEIIRALKPIDIQVQGTDVVILRSGDPAEYHLSRRPHDRKPWVLYVVGTGNRGHEELLRLDHD
jgi:hypothetical protein